jgi:hypothetical protein
MHSRLQRLLPVVMRMHLEPPPVRLLEPRCSVFCQMHWRPLLLHRFKRRMQRGGFQAATSWRTLRERVFLRCAYSVS